jgi:hypothetical protein
MVCLCGNIEAEEGGLLELEALRAVAVPEPDAFLSRSALIEP